MKRTLVSFAVAMLAGCTAFTPASEPERVIEAMIDAYETRDLDAMIEVFDEGIEWMSVSGSTITVVSTGRPSLRSMMAENLESHPDASWTVEAMQRVGPYVATTEYAEWDGGASYLRNAVMYEVRDGLVRRIWFYPSVD